MQIHAPTGDPIELMEFIREQKKYYEDFFSGELGRPSGKKFGWEQYQSFKESWTKEELESKLENLSRKKELIHLHARHFLFAEIAGYLNSLVYDKMYRRKGDGITDLTLRETIAYYDIQTQFKVSLSASKIPLSNIAMSISLSTGYAKETIEREMKNVTHQDYKVAWQKFKEIANNYSPPPK